MLASVVWSPGGTCPLSQSLDLGWLGGPAASYAMYEHLQLSSVCKNADRD